MELSSLLQNLGCARHCGTELNWASRGSVIASHPPYGASGSQSQSRIWILVCCILLIRGCNYSGSIQYCLHQRMVNHNVFLLYFQAFFQVFSIILLFLLTVHIWWKSFVVNMAFTFLCIQYICYVLYCIAVKNLLQLNPSWCLFQVGVSDTGSDVFRLHFDNEVSLVSETIGAHFKTMKSDPRPCSVALCLGLTVALFVSVYRFNSNIVRFLERRKKNPSSLGNGTASNADLDDNCDATAVLLKKGMVCLFCRKCVCVCVFASCLSLSFSHALL